MLWLLWLLPILVALVFWANRGRQNAARRFASEKMLARLRAAPSAVRFWIKAILVVSSLGLLIVAIARPQFGTYYEHSTQHGVDIMVLLDVSRSMLAEDLKPSRLDRAKSDIVDLLDRLEGDRVGLVAFAGAPVLKVCLLYTSPSPRDATLSRMPSSA